MSAKAAITGLTRGLARELGPDRIRVNALMPGMVLTERQLELWITPEIRAAHLERQCLKEHLVARDMVEAHALSRLQGLAHDDRAGAGRRRRRGGDRMTAPAWIAVDWGTSNLRAWAMDEAGAALAEAASPAGMGGLARDGFEPALVALIDPWLAPGRRTDVIACGMVGARQGWIEAPYAAVPGPPAAPAPSPARRCATRAWRCTCCTASARPIPADVMRGEETQIAGLIAREPGFDGVACLPGTHAKWAHVSAGEVVSFSTFMTGELFALIAQSSVLRHSVAQRRLVRRRLRAGRRGQPLPPGAARRPPLRHPGRGAADRAAARARPRPALGAPDRRRARRRPPLLARPRAGADRRLAPRRRLPRRARASAGSRRATLDATAMTLAGLTAAHAQLLTERAET